MSIYPDKINRRFVSPKNLGTLPDADASGTGASFDCGTSARISLSIDPVTQRIDNAKFRTSGCGFAIASADLICELLIGRKLTDLHGLDDVESALEPELGEIPGGRQHCANICFEGLQQALTKYRSLKVGEWTGERALICSCFGVTEDRIESEISENLADSVESVGRLCNAGTGCGSCQPLIQEIIDGSFD